MEKDIRVWLEQFHEGVINCFWKRVVGILACTVFLGTIYILILPVMALSDDKSYTLSLRDSYNYEWKTEELGYETSYDLRLYFMDTSGNYIEGSDVTIEIGPSKLADDFYGFGYVPLKSTSTTESRGQDLIEFLNLREYITSTGEKYEFDHAEVKVDDTWQKLTADGRRWHIWCQNSSSTVEPVDKNYSWRGRYGTAEVPYEITNDTEYKFIYRLVRYGNDKTVTSLGADSGITFKMFNYTGANDETGINDNGIYEYFTFRDSNIGTPTKINAELDADGFGTNRAKVLTKLDSEGYPVFDCQGKCSSNPSLGYLFGSSVNPVGIAPVGVEKYTPINTLLQKETIDEVEYYYYDSNRNAVDYDTDNNRFLVRDYVERAYSMSTYENEADRYEFLPFNYLNSSDEVKINTTTNLEYNYERDEIDHWYGMTMEFTFYMPKDGKINGKDMIFSFTGDDDVWVFIDDVLVLDLGGTHGSVDGTINFGTGEVEGYLNWNNTVGTPNVTNIYQAYYDANSIDVVNWKDITTEDGGTKIFDDYTKHTLKFFYLERGAAVANCKIRFNIPVLPTGSLSVQKQFDGVDRYDDTYEFSLYDVTAGAVVANTEYTIGENKFTTDENGRFRLKNNEMAIFKLINEHKYYVEEIDTGMHAVSYKCSFDGADCPEINKTPEFVMNPESAYQAVFINKVKTYDLQVKKIAYNSEINEAFEFKIQIKNKDRTLDGVLNNINSINNYEIDDITGTITFSLKNEEVIIINGIPIDTEVMLQETLHDGYNTVIKTGDIVLADGDIYEFVMDSNKDIQVYNIPGVILPETGGNGVRRFLILGICLMSVSLGLLIRKEGD